MTYEKFKSSLQQADPPKIIKDEIKALWYSKNGNWDKAHKIVQEMNTQASSWVHAYLHREEGDLSNASYWYGRADKPVSTKSPDEEWEQLTKTLLGD